LQQVAFPQHHLLVDIDDGYVDPEVACHVIEHLERIGASGAILEDRKRPRRWRAGWALGGGAHGGAQAAGATLVSDARCADRQGTGLLQPRWAMSFMRGPMTRT
jgi:hypothetical protein